MEIHYIYLRISFSFIGDLGLPHCQAICGLNRKTSIIDACKASLIMLFTSRYSECSEF